jgi:hypothetical protein
LLPGHFKNRETDMKLSAMKVHPALTEQGDWVENISSKLMGVGIDWMIADSRAGDSVGKPTTRPDRNPPGGDLGANSSVFERDECIREVGRRYDGRAAGEGSFSFS